MRNQPIRNRLKRAACLQIGTLLMAGSVITYASPAFAQESAGSMTAAARAVVAPSGVAAPLAAAAFREAIRLAQSPPVQPPPSEQGRGWVTRHPVLVGTLIGTAGGAVLSRTSVGGGNHDPRVALLGTGVGAWSGLIASAVQKARAGEKVGIGTKIGIAAGAVSLIVLPLAACYGAGGCGGVS